MKVLVACEYSGTVRDAFIERGHDAMSCDLLPSEAPGPHYQGDVRDILYRHHVSKEEQWDLVIAFPPCTDLCVSGARWFAEKRADGRQAASIEFFNLFTRMPIRWAIENPVGIMSTQYRKPDQIIQPWQFGHGETKATCLWLNGLPKLTPTDIVAPEWAVNPDGSINLSAKGKRDNPTHFLTGRIRVLKGAQRDQWERIHRCPPPPERWKIRSKTYKGIAAAMAEQWGAFIMVGGR